ncbi:MAG: deaminase [Chloroflexi bacterium]|nr:MAG: deaminase [Chloroflexota bacterium]
MDKPKVIVYQTASLDGRLSVSADKLLLYGDERWTAAAGQGNNVWELVKWTHQPQATLEGSGSFIREGDVPEPLPAVEGDTSHLYLDFLPEQILNRPGHKGWFTVVDSRGRVRWYYKEFPDPAWEGWYLLVLVCRSTPPEYLAYLQREDIPYLVAGEERVDLRQAFEKMCSTLEVSSIISTAGGKLNGVLLRTGLIDEVNVEVFPALIGGESNAVLFDSPDLKEEENPLKLELITANIQPDGRIWLRYRAVK